MEANKRGVKRVAKSQSTDGEKPKKIRLSEEDLKIPCEWDICNILFDSWENLDSHLMAHIDTESELLECKWANCDHRTTALHLLEQHISHHGYLAKLTTVGANLVNKNSLSVCRLKRVVEIPIEEKGFVCSWGQCTVAFWTIFGFISHLYGHFSSVSNEADDSKRNVFRCRWRRCSSAFSVKGKLKEHLRTHSQEKIIGCPSCFSIFSNNTKFIDHRNRQHQTNFQCPECHKFFGSERLLRDHARTHSRHLQCPRCEVTASTPSHLAEHMRYVQVRVKPVICQICTSTFTAKRNLLSHMKTHSKKQRLPDYGTGTQEGNQLYAITNQEYQEHDSSPGTGTQEGNQSNAIPDQEYQEDDVNVLLVLTNFDKDGNIIETRILDSGITLTI